MYLGLTWRLPWILHQWHSQWWWWWGAWVPCGCCWCSPWWRGRRWRWPTCLPGEVGTCCIWPGWPSPPSARCWPCRGRCPTCCPSRSRSAASPGPPAPLSSSGRGHWQPPSVGTFSSAGTAARSSLSSRETSPAGGHNLKVFRYDIHQDTWTAALYVSFRHFMSHLDNCGEVKSEMSSS